MSSVYVLEPPTRGKVILNTSCGSLDIELWSKEAPKACRNFVQLCMEGYYDRTIFHRIIPGFIVQGGDPTGTGQGGESIYGEPFEDEIHTRLKFRQRGFVACANANEKNSNSSQFFVTLDRCDGLNGKHTIFGKITGDTIYNLLKLGDCETDKDDRPLEPPRIISTEILWNPFDDIVPRKLKRPEAAPQIQDAQPQVKQKKKLNLLSFGEEALQEEEEVTAVNKKIRSSHDVLNDPRLLKGSESTTSKTRRREEEKTAAEQEERKRQEDEEVRRRKELQTSVRQALAAKQIDDAAKDDDIDEMSFDQRMREEVLEKRKQLGKSSDRPPKAPNRNSKEYEDRDEGEKEEKVEQEEQEEQEEQDNGRIIRDKLVIKKKGLGSEARAELALQRNADMQLLTPLQQQREKYKQRKRNLQGREESTIELLNKFKERLEQDKDLLNHKLEFPMDDKKKRTDDVDHYVVQDPLLERGKEKFNKMQAKMKKRSREWAGRSLT